MHEQTNIEVVVGGRFRLVESICADAFGVIFRAVDQSDGGSVHVRAIDPSVCVALGASREALALARGPSAVRHPHLAALLDVIVDDDRWYLVSEACEGESLAEHIARDGRLDEDTAASIVTDIASALAAIHARGAVHGRLDPSRIILDPSGVKVCDLGLGMLLGDETEDWRTTIRDVEDPTIAFLSPEQARGDGAPTRWSDIWALTAILHFAVTGASPYSVKTRAAQASSATKARLFLPEAIDARITSLMRQGLAPEPALRPTLAELVDRLRPRRVVRWPRVAVALVGVALVLAGIEFPATPTTPRLSMHASARSSVVSRQSSVVSRQIALV